LARLAGGGGSGEGFVINPPRTLKQRMARALNYLANKLGIDGNGFARVKQLVRRIMPELATYAANDWPARYCIETCAHARG